MTIDSGSVKRLRKGVPFHESQRESPFAGRQLKELELPRGLYPAVVLRGEDVYTPHESLQVMGGDSLLLGAMGTSPAPCRIEEVCLETGHRWIGSRIKELDISRRMFVIMVKRGNKNICPQGATVLKEKDVVLILEK